MTDFHISDVPPGSNLLRGLSEAETDIVLRSGRPHWFAKREVMTFQGEPAKAMFLMWKGRGRYFYNTPEGRKRILRAIIPGQVCGPSALAADQHNYLVSSETIVDSVTVQWSHETLRSLAERFPQLMMNAHRIDMEYIAWHISHQTNLIALTARKRLASVLFSLMQSFGHRVADGIEVDVSNEELADSANITPFTTSRLTTEWQRCGAIRKTRGKIVILSPSEKFLAKVAHAQSKFGGARA
jgi:CRP-like cAMP-binding protein